MQTVAIVFLTIAGLLSAVLMPNMMGALTLMLVSAARAAALALALLFWVASGRLDSWGLSRVMWSLVAIVGAALLSVGCFMIQMTRDDNVPPPWPMVYRLAAALLPVCFMASALLSSRKMFLIVSVLAPVAGVVVISTWEPLNKAYVASLPQSKEQRERDQLLARRMLELDQVPQTAGLEPLLGFVTPGELAEVVSKAEDRIRQTPDWIPKVSAMLDGENRLQALYVLTRHPGLLPADVAERCWSASAQIARERMELLKNGSLPMESEKRMLLDSVVEMAQQSDETRQVHCKEMAAAREFLLASNGPVGTGLLDLWVRETELQRIPGDAGIVPLLEFTAPSEVWNVRQDALARIATDPESTAKLANLLDGPHRLEALVVLSERVDALPEDLRGRCWQAVGLTAREMAAGVAHGKPPTRIDVRKLSASAGAFWAILGGQEGRLGDLAAVRDVVRAVGDDVEKASFAWADSALASTTSTQSGKHE